jgi:tetratricopeptide (TPR) repeat protein
MKRAITRKTLILFLSLAAFVTLVYSNHFTNEFHFDDFHTIVQNPYIRDIHNLPRFFVDTETTSVLPANRTWRPLVFASLAIDYRLGKAMKPFYFHLSTFLWFLILLALMFALFRKIFDQSRPSSEVGNLWAASFATALFALHPAVAETVNYIIQRADLYSTLGVVASLVTWIYFPGMRRYGVYLLPLAAAVLSKPPAIVFPVILFLYVWLFEEVDPRAALRHSIPSLLTVLALGWLSSAMAPSTFVPGAFSAYGYRITQPIVIFRYFRTFFLPTGLTADTDRLPFDSIFDGDALFGFVFVIGLLYTAIRMTRRSETRPVAFGLFWFLLAVLPTSVFPLAEVENDHRMFFPFVGLALSSSWVLALWLSSRPARRGIASAACVVLLLIFAAGTWQRNRIWRTEESLWYDVTLKSSRNGRGLMNYGLTQMSKGETPRALDYFQRALVYNPNYYVLEVNLGVANGALHNDAEAERHFARAIQLAPTEAVPQYYYAVWLRGKGRLSEAIRDLNTAITNNPTYLEAPHLLMDIYTQQQEANALRQTAWETLERFPSDPASLSWLAAADTLKPSAETYLNQSLTFYQQGKFEESIQAAREALKLRPDYSDAWNNIAAAYNSESRWDEGISAALQAIRFKPDNQLAKNNLAWAIQQKQRASRTKGKGL